MAGKKSSQVLITFNYSPIKHHLRGGQGHKKGPKGHIIVIQNDVCGASLSI